MKRLLTYLAILTINCQLSTVLSQVSTDFWFAVPYLVNGHDNSAADGMGKICITSFADTAHITISQPAVTAPNNPRYFAPITYTLPPYSSHDFPVQQGSISRSNQSGQGSNGIHITSDRPIGAYYAQVNNNSEIYTLKGRNALGTSFLVAQQSRYGNAFSASPTIEIVATENNTQVVIATPVLTYTNRTNTNWTITLQQGETYTIRGMNSNANNHLCGTVITSNKPIAVNTTDDSAASTGQDLIGEQIVPTNLAGNEYIAIKHESQNEYLYLAAFPGRPITFSVNNGVLQTLAGGSSTVLTLTSRATYIMADDEFVAFQITADGGELGGTVLPRLDCTGSYEVAYKKRFSMQYLTLLVKTAFTGAFTINGQAAYITFTPVPDAPQWSYVVLLANSLFDQNGVFRIANSSALFHAAIMDYGGGTCSYGYFSDYNYVSLSAFSDKPVYQQGETIQLSIANPQLFSNVVWTFPDGTTHTGASVTNIAEDLTDAGNYTVSAESVEGCPVELEHNEVIVAVELDDPEPPVTPEPVDTLCVEGRILFYEDFGGNDPSDPQVSTNPVPSIAPTYHQVFSNAYGSMVSGGYLVAKRGYHNGAGSWSQWLLTGDHTHPGDTTRGYFLQVDGRSNGALLYEVTIPNLTPGAEISFSAYVANMEFWKTNGGLSYVRPELGFRMKDTNNNTLSTASSGPIPIDTTKTTSATEAQWYRVGMQFVVPAGVTTCVLQIFDNAQGYGAGNDFGIDDITVIECGAEDPEPEPEPEPGLNIAILNPNIMLCDGDDSFTLDVRVKEGTPHLCEVSIGGTSALFEVAAPVATPPYDFAYPITLPEELASMLSPLATPVSVDVTFYDTTLINPSLEERSGGVSLTILYAPEGIFAQKWDNVLAIFSPEYSSYHLAFTTTYQWYRNGLPIPGANGSYYRLGEMVAFDLNDYYQAEVTRVSDGVTLMTCPYYPHEPAYEQKAPEPEKVIINQHLYIRIADTLYSLDGQLVEK